MEARLAENKIVATRIGVFSSGTSSLESMFSNFDGIRMNDG